ncbi:MAG TPA: alpha-keto acid decarboxylase family protein [Candidatus Brocadiaceae bacterium]
MGTVQTISDYLIQQLYAYGVRHVFGVPGDYVLRFFHDLENSKLKVINTCDEQGAGFAADAYARMRGLGVVCVTYCVGGLKIANTTAQAFAEQSPVIIISGSPGTNERIKNPLLHHKVRDFDTQLKVFEQLTVATTVLNNPETAFQEIDRVLTAAVRYKRPVYIEIPRDMVSMQIVPRQMSPMYRETSDPHVLQEALREAEDLINAAQKPVIIAGVELNRFGLRDALLQFIDTTNIPVASTLLSKSVITERHPRYLGVYEGAICHEDVRAYVESSDCLILLGTFLTETDLGIFTANIEKGRSIYVTSEKTSIRYHTYEGVHVHDFIYGLLKANIRRREPDRIPHPEISSQFYPVTGKQITTKRLFQRLNAFLDDTIVVIADTGDALFAAASELSIHSAIEFHSPAYYTSMGFAVPASIGIQLASPKLRPLVLVGDGAFQMTGMELATVARFNLNPIVIVLNNGGYGTERPMLDGSFNDLCVWQYSRIPEILGTGKGFIVETEEQLEDALEASRKHTGSFCILDVRLGRHDYSPALQHLTSMLAQKISMKA